MKRADIQVGKTYRNNPLNSVNVIKRRVEKIENWCVYFRKDSGQRSSVNLDSFARWAYAEVV
jgi:hypothetical protein